MATLWTKLQNLAQDQLFTHGYLTASTAVAIAQRRAAAAARERVKVETEQRHQKLPHTQIAAFR